MSVGLLALLDEVALLARTAAASLDDIAAQTAKAGIKSAGIVIDDAAVTPGYVTGLPSDREIPIIVRIAKGSLKNKLLFLLPAALLLASIAPGLITPLLMLGGLYLAYEGAEKVLHAVRPHAAEKHEKEVQGGAETAEELEEIRVASAIRTDFILSAEIMALTLSTVADAPFLNQALVLGIVGTLITFAVYGAVALLVRADDFGIRLAATDPEEPGAEARIRFGRLLVSTIVPRMMTGLTVVGTAAMLWVGGGILIHGLAEMGQHGLEHAIHHWAEGIGQGFGVLEGAMTWIANAAAAGVVGLAVGLASIPFLARALLPLWQVALGPKAD
ncbi:MAG: DUF808 domain-containing protein [Pseudomonadota bacterium]